MEDLKHNILLSYKQALELIEKPTKSRRFCLSLVNRIKIATEVAGSYYTRIVDEDLRSLYEDSMIRFNEDEVEYICSTNEVFLSFLADEIEMFFLEDPLAVRAIVETILFQLDTTLQNIGLITFIAKFDTYDYPSKDRYHMLSAFKIFNSTYRIIRELSIYAPMYKIISVNEFSHLEREINYSGETKLKSTLPVYYRFELLKILGIEDKLKGIETEGDKNAVVCNLVNCNEKTARQLRVGKYQSGRSIENDEEYKRLLNLFD